MNIFCIKKFFILIFPFISCFSDGYNNLYNWLISNGAFISENLIPIEQDIYNRYIITKEKIKKDEEILFIPNILTLSTLNNLVLDECNIGFKEFISSSSKEEKFSFDFDCLVYYLTVDMDNKNSFFKFYYEYLPQISDNNFPIYFTDDKINVLKNIELDIEIGRQKHFFNKSLTPVKDKIMKMKNGLEKFKKNFIYVSTRNMGRRTSFFEDVNTLVPYLDLLNHNNNFNTWFIYDEKREGFSLYAVRDIEKEEEITISYGRLNNIYLYSMYGFTIKDNIYRTNINIKIDGKKLTVFPKEKKEQIKRIMKQFKNYDSKTLLIKLKESLMNRLNEYRTIAKLFKNDINIINICNDLINTVQSYILLC